jgi:formate dehydrogenase maturation protein FdhE
VRDDVECRAWHACCAAHRRHPDTVKAENCRSYVKILYQVNDHRLDAFADDDAHPLA